MVEKAKAKAEFGPKDGELVTINHVVYELRVGLSLEELKAREGGERGFRCRHGWHNFEIVGWSATLALIEMQAPAERVELNSRIGRIYSDLKQCTRCGEVGRHFR